MKVAIVHDFVGEYGGATGVLFELLKMFPNSDLYTLYIDRGEKKNKFIIENTNKVVCWWIDKIPFLTKLPYYRAMALFFSANFWERLDLSAYDVVISSTFGFGASGVITRPDVLHLCYVHTPAKRLYTERSLMSKKYSWGANVLSFLLKKRRIWDFVAAQRPDVVVANSVYTKGKVAKFWRRDSVVVYPPIKKLKGKVGEAERDFYIYFGRLVFDKGLELIIETFNKNGKKLVVVGDGEMRSYLEVKAKKNIELVGFVEDRDLFKMFTRAKACVFASKGEDFGMALVEVMSTGLPVIAFDAGGPREIIDDGKNGVLFNDYSAKGLTQAVERFEKMEIKSKACVDKANFFTKQDFRKNILKIIKVKQK